MKRTLGALCAAVAVASTTPSAFALETAQAINGADSTQHYAIVAPVYLGTNTGPQSFIRFFNGAGTTASTSTFTVTVVGEPSGQTYGSTTLAIPHFASIQLSIQEILSLANASTFMSGDSGYALYIQNSDSEAGYQHVVYDWTTNLFENMSNCDSLLNEQMLSLHNNLVLPNVHTSKVGDGQFPSTITIHNYANTSTVYSMGIYNAGGRLSGSSFQASSNSGNQTCTYDVTVPANSTVAVNESTIEGANSCVLDSDESYANIVVTNKSGGAPNARLAHTVRVSQFNGNSNMTAACAVNKISTTTATPASTTTFGGVVTGSGTTSGTLSVTVQASIATAASVREVSTKASVEKPSATSTATGTFKLSSGTSVSLSGTYNSSTSAITVSGSGYTFTGTVSGTVFTGSVTGPGNTTGGFSAVSNGDSTKPTGYCGSATSAVDGTVFKFSFAVASSGKVSGSYSNSGGLAGVLSGTKSGSTVSGTYTYPPNPSLSNGTFTATIQTSGSVSGTFRGADDNGNISGSACTVP